MQGMVPPDPESGVSDLRYAVVYAPRSGRKRFSASCVEVHVDAAAARTAANADTGHYAAQVLGPSKSSEGQTLYYLLEWL